MQTSNEGVVSDRKFLSEESDRCFISKVVISLYPTSFPSIPNAYNERQKILLSSP